MIIRAFLLGLAFWGLTFLFPAITISGFWTITGVIFTFGVLNIIYNISMGILFIPLNFLTLGFLTLVINTGMVYLLAHWFSNFTIEPASFWPVLLFTFLYTLAANLLFTSK